MAAKNNTDIGFEKQIWDAACVLWGHIPAAEYRKVIVGLIFLRYISSAFEKRYEELIKEMMFYDSLLNELHYLNNIANPKGKEFRIKEVYPHIDNNIKDLVGDVSLHQNIAKLLGTLRANISLYNSALEKGAGSDVLEEALNKIYNLIDPINTERFENYTNAQSLLRNFEIRTAERIINEK